jgi:simple sugar transport system ATP-binding protein
VSESALELRQIARRFGDVVALSDANLVVRGGTVHAVLGENGAGKTTLMRVAYGMLRPMSGQILVGGRRRTFGSPADAIDAGIAMVQQHPSNVTAMTVWENVYLGGSGFLDPASARETVRHLAQQVGFSLNPETRVSDLSVAAQQRLEILKAIHRKARIIILDEPTAILAPTEAADLYAWLREFAEGGGTAVVVTHKLEEARKFTDDLTVLRAGRSVLQSPSSDISSGALADAMLGEALAAPVRRVGSGTPGEIILKGDRVTLVDDRNVVVIRDASFEVRAGEVVGVAGVEGSGHHELLLAMAARHDVHSGEIRGSDASSIVPEDRHLNAVVLDFTLTENAAMRNAGARQGTVGWTRMSERVREFLDRYDVRAPGPSSRMRALSGGNQQKFVLARELDGDPALIVAENPTRGLDIRASAFVREQIRAARGRGAAVVVYSSDLDEILDLADRVLVVHSGVVSEVALDRGRIGAAMLGAA